MEKTIIIIDDDPIFRLITKKMIERFDLQCLKLCQCENGKSGLSKLKKMGSSHQEITVLLDINMPVLNGWEFLDELEKNNYYEIQDLSVYIVSSSTDERDINKAKSYDIVRQFISKPVNITTIKSIIDER